ncbi:MAG: GNAT family N-acetyltransferase [Anaerolineae bacterium]|nr:GNAT family N-acetyltransferase [Anaerolineae bacterium]
MYSFRKARPDQADAIFSLYGEVVVEGEKNGTSHWSEEYPTRVFLDEDIESQRIFVLEDGNTIIAAVSLLETDDLDDEPVGWKDVKSCVPVRLCVSPKYQGQHIGEHIMNCLIDYVKPQGYQSMRLLAVVNSIAANRLYTRMGFVCLGVVHLYEHSFNAYELVF